MAAPASVFVVQANLNDAESPVDDFMWEKTEVGDGIAITEYMGTATEVGVPATIDGLPVTSIGSETFYGYTRLTSIALPDSVTYIGERAFGGCTGLTRITIPDGVTRIEGWVFECCSSLASITIPESVVKIDTGAFYECTNLTWITIPANMTHIADAVFSVALV